MHLCAQRGFASKGLGLIGAIAAWYAGTVRLIGVEPEMAPTLTWTLEAGRPVGAEAGELAADSLAPKRVGALMYPIARQYVERVVLVPNRAVEAAQQTLWDVMWIVTEPGGAAAFAALLSGQYRPCEGERVGVLLFGGDATVIDFARRTPAT